MPMKFSGLSVSIPFQFSEGEHRSNSQKNQRLSNAKLKSVENGSEEEGIKEFRVKIMSDLETVRDKIIQSMLHKDVSVEEVEKEKQDRKSWQEKEREVEISPEKPWPWNMRKKRAVYKEIPVSANQLNQTKNCGFVVIEERIVNQSPSSRNVIVVTWCPEKLPMLRDGSQTTGIFLPEKVIEIKKGDSIALPFGVVTWWFNNEDTELVVLFLGRAWDLD